MLKNTCNCVPSMLYLIAQYFYDYSMGGLCGMAWYDILIGAALLIAAIVIIGIILLQEGRRQGIAGAISGGADTFLSKTKARTADATLARVTKYIAIAFFVLVLIANVICAF